MISSYLVDDPEGDPDRFFGFVATGFRADFRPHDEFDRVIDLERKTGQSVGAARANSARDVM